MHRKALVYSFLRHPTKPKLYGGNVGIFREDYQRINGYDENFRGWGCEDDDLRLRLRQAGVRIRSVLGATRTYHLWHPPGQTTPQRWRDGANVDYLHRQERSARCERGLSLRLSEPDRTTIHRWSQQTLARQPGEAA
jgi:GT2 family glycosyltransferase